MDLPRYRSRHAAGRNAVPVVLVWSVVLVVGALAVQRLCDWLPFAYVYLVLSVVFGVTIGLIAKAAILRGRIRGDVFMLGLVLWMVVLSEAAIFGWGYLGSAVFRSGGTFAAYLAAYVDQGWLLNDKPLNDWPVYWIWTAQLGLVLWTAWMGGSTVFRRPYCERCQQWTVSKALG